jgi:FtsP/CotA-like multicopper oxidase with cupredoxin domain
LDPFSSNPTYGFWGLNLVNLHFHGAEFPPSVERVDLAVDGGESKTYVFDIPEDREPGLFWYHNHVHGTTAHAYMANLYGFIVIEGTESDIDKAPGIEGATEVFMILTEGLVDPESGRAPPFFPIVGAVDFWYSVANGYSADETHYEFEVGEVVLFRVAAAGVEPPIRLFIPGQKFVVVARDGFPLSEPEEVDVVEVFDGGRVEFLARFDEPGDYTMSRQAWGSIFASNDEECMAGFGMPYPCISYDKETVVATITVSGDSSTAATEDLISTIELPGLSEKRLARAEQPSLDSKTITLEMATSFPLFQVPLTGEPGPPGVGFGMNGRFATPYYTSGSVVADSCETWTVIANPPGTDHAFHVHSAKFLVLAEDGVELGNPYWRDTIVINFNATLHVCFEGAAPGVSTAKSGFLNEFHTFC